MRAKITKMSAGLAAVGALAVGGASLATAGGNNSPVVPPAVSAPADTTQVGDQTAPDSAQAAESGPEVADSTESASESVSANDGPGGHADPANAAIDHQFEGAE